MDTVKKIWSIATTVLVAVVVILALLLAGPRLMGMQVFTVLSGSMEPVYHTGSLIYVRDVDPMEIQPGQVITFMLDEDTVATHRVVEVVPDEIDRSVVRFRTKGDANEEEDPMPVSYEAYIGSVVCSLPYVGAFLTVMTSFYGKITAMGVVVLGMILNLIGSKRA